jgi:alkanesulfonate monooxygenase
MKVRIFVEPQQGAGYAELLRVAQDADELGFDGFFRSDHYLRMGGGSGLPGPTDAWVTLAALARETTRVRLGTLVSPATFRLPGPLAISVAQIDEMSGGRVELGLGTGWFEQEHAAYGIPFPSIGERFDVLSEQLAVIDGLWRTPAGERFTFAGKHYHLTDAPALPKPVQRPRPPIILGGAGKKRSAALAARYADEYNVSWASPQATDEIFDRLRGALAAVGRDEASMTFSVAQATLVAASTAEVRRRAEGAGHLGPMADDALRGTPSQILERLAEFAAVGVRTVYLQYVPLPSRADLELVAAEILPHAAAL